MLLRYKGILMSGEGSHSLLVTDFTPPTTSIRGDFTERYGADGVLPSREFLGESYWTWTVVTNAYTMFDAIRLAGDLERAWKDPAVRASTAPVPLEYSNDGGATWYRVYGRPGRITGFAPDIQAKYGVGSIELEFVQTDHRHFSNEERSVVVGADASVYTGLRTPLTTPLTLVKTAPAQSGELANYGELPSPLRVIFRGPGKNPVVTNSKGLEVGYNGALAYDQSVVLDAMSRTVKLGNAPVQGRVTRKTRLSSVAIPSGSSAWSFRVTDPTGTASATLAWRDAYTSMQY